MTEAQIEGVKLFVDAGCVACKNSPVFTNNNFHQFELRVSKDERRFLVTGQEVDKFAF